MTRTDGEGVGQPTRAHGPTEQPGVRVVSSSELMKGGRLLVIRHGDAAYRLQITQGGKLILTK